METSVSVSVLLKTFLSALFPLCPSLQNSLEFVRFSNGFDSCGLFVGTAIAVVIAGVQVELIHGSDCMAVAVVVSSIDTAVLVAVRRGLRKVIVVVGGVNSSRHRGRWN